MEKEAVEWLRENLEDRGKIFVGFSGGKDSIVTAKLMEMSGIDHQLVYTNTTIDPPPVLKFIKEHYPHCKWVRPKHSFWSMIPKLNPPLRFSRWCCWHIKKIPSWRIKIDHRVLGIRKEESHNRRDYKRKDLINTGTYRSYYKRDQNHTHYHPILDWKEWQVWEFIKEHNLAYPELYSQFDRLGCVVCPMRYYKEHDKWKKLYPGYYKAFESACRKWHAKRLGEGKTLAYDTADEFINAWYKGHASWYKGKRK